LFAHISYPWLHTTLADAPNISCLERPVPAEPSVPVEPPEPEVIKCSSETDDKWLIYWPTTNAGYVATTRCNGIDADGQCHDVCIVCSFL